MAGEFHAGEIEVQRRAGVEDLARLTATVMKPYLPGRAEEFVAEQPVAVVASVGEDGGVWASLLVGAPGFMRVEDSRTLRIEAEPAVGDPLGENLREGAAVGLLVIDLGTRRRMKIKGRVQTLPGVGFRLRTERAYVLCPKYIQTRSWELLESEVGGGSGGRPSESSEGGILDEDQRRRISGADTFFIASFHPQTGADPSHRGGFAGFVEVADDMLVWPDYPGNRMFNTLGNITVNPNAGLLFPDFAKGGALQLAGEATVIWDEDVVSSFPGAERAMGFRVSEALETTQAIPLRWSFGSYSPFNPPPKRAIKEEK